MDVYLQIAARRYRVLPQFEIVGRRIDLVVEGMQGRLAVECDGDVWHGAEQYGSDLARQRQLERAGMHFWRIRGSVFYGNPEDSLAPLWSELARRGIHPEIAAPTPARTREPSLRDERHESVGASSGPNVPGSPLAPTADYVSWKPRELPNPLSGDEDEVIQGLVEIITAEGPMTRRRAFKIYVRASGSRLRETVVPALHRALTRAIRKHQIEQRNEGGGRETLDFVVRKFGVPPVRVRTRGDRGLEDIPPSEIASLADLVRAKQPACSDEELLRTVQDFYGIKRLTGRPREELMAAVRQRLDFGPKIHVI